MKALLRVRGEPPPLPLDDGRRIRLVCAAGLRLDLSAEPPVPASEESVFLQAGRDKEAGMGLPCD